MAQLPGVNKEVALDKLKESTKIMLEIAEKSGKPHPLLGRLYTEKATQLTKLGNTHQEGEEDSFDPHLVRAVQALNVSRCILTELQEEREL